MKRNLAMAGMLIVLASLAWAAELTGKWEGSFTYNDQAVPVSIELKGSTEISGTVTGLPGGVAQIKDAKLDGETLSFWIMIDFQGNPLKIVYKGKVSGKEIKFMMGTDDGSWGTELIAKKV
jgi:hypothetical protein